MLKADLRKVFRKKRDELSVSDQMRYDDLLLIQLQTLSLPHLKTVLSFYPVKENNEVDTFPITDFLHFRNPQLTICYPRINRPTNEFAAVAAAADSIFAPNQYNIPEPTDATTVAAEDVDLVLTPLLAFDEAGMRVGYGKGYYDRFFKDCRGDCLKIGLSYFEAVEAITDANEFDVALDLCITPQRIYVF